MFIPFGMMFFKISKKHNVSIHNYKEEYHYFFHFFDLISFIIMVFMMDVGIVLRKFELVPLRFIAVFYTGLKAGLLLAGINFMYYFIQEINIDEQERRVYEEIYKLCILICGSGNDCRCLLS